MRLLRFSLICGLVAVTSILPTRVCAGPLAIDQVQVLDSVAGVVIPNRCVRIEAGLIIRIEQAGSSPCTERAEVFDAANGYLIPGLIDMHAHLTLGPLEIVRERGKATMQARADDQIAAHNGRRLVAFGVTTVRSPGGELDAAARYESRLQSGELTGPQSFHAGEVINNAAIAGLAVSVDDAVGMQQLVAAQVGAGADWIKLYTGLNPELLQAGIDAAHAHGLPAVAHLDQIAWPDALAMGLDGLVHLMPLSPDLLSDAERAAWQADSRPGAYAFFEWWEHFDPDGPSADQLVAAFDQYRPVFDATLVAFHAAFVEDQESSPYKFDAAQLAHPRLLANWTEWFTFAAGWQAEDFVRARAIWPKVERMAQRLYASKARMTIGTDMSNPWIAPGISFHREMALLAQAKVPNERILRAATATAAEALGAGQRLGQIAVGFEADLVLLENNPLERIEHTLGIAAVVLDGRWLSADDLAALKEK